jgi:tetratricopeptide (TPR) repeat protein
VDFFVSRPEPSVVMAKVDASIKLVEAMLSSADPRAAARLLESCLTDVPADRRGELLLRMGNALVLDGDYQEAIPNLVRAIGEFQHKGDRHSTGRCHQSLGYCYAHVGPLEQSEGCFEIAESLLQAEDRWKPRVAMAVIAERRGEYSQALERVDKARSTSSLPHAALYCQGVRSDIYASQDDWARVHAEELRLVEEAEALGSTDQIAERLISVAFASIYTADPKVEFRVAQALGYLQSSGDKARTAYLLTVRSAYALSCSEATEAKRLGQAALKLAIHGKYRRAELRAYLRLAEVSLSEGNLVEARLTLFNASAYAESYEYASEKLYCDTLLAFIAALQGDRKTAEERSASVVSPSPIISALAAETARLLHNGNWDKRGMLDRLMESGISYLPGFTVTASDI